MKHLASTMRRIDERRARVLGELHPELRRRVEAVLSECDGMLAPWCGYRGREEQEAARAKGASKAKWMQSPHNYRPALACDLVLDPRAVPVRSNPHNAEYPDLWDNTTLEAVAAWSRLEVLAAKFKLERVFVDGVRDRPHVQLPGWRNFIPV